MEEEYSVIDLFAGAGGLSEGFTRKGFRLVASVEKDRYSTYTLRTRIVYRWLRENNLTEIYREYIHRKIDRETFYSKVAGINLNDLVISQEISDENICATISRIRKNMEHMSVKKINVIIGAPPCQPYSLVGRARNTGRINADDTRRSLYKYYLQFLDEFKPQIFVFENVPGMKNIENGAIFLDMTEGMEKLGYNFESRKLDAKDFFVLQCRRRLIIIGWRNDLDTQYPDFKPVKHPYLVKDVLHDLPIIEPGEGSEVTSYVAEPSKYLRESGIRDNFNLLTHHVARPHNDRDKEIYRLAIKLWEKEARRLKYTDIPEKLQTHKNKKSFLDRFKVVAKDLQYSQTITAHLSKDGHYYIHPDINQARSLTAREAARLQSFPDDYLFEGPRTAKFAQIGNAVPPLMAEHIADKVKEMLK